MESLLLKSGSGADLDAITATAEDIVSPKVGLDSEGEPLAGTLKDNSGATKSAAASLDTANSRVQLTVPETAKYSTTSKLYAAYDKIRSLIGLTADKLWTDVTILGLKSSRTALGSKTYTPGTASQTIASGVCLTGAQTIKGDSNLKAANIKKGVSIFGVAGTWEGYYAPDPSYLVYKGNNPGDFGLNDSLLGLTKNGTIHSCFGDFLLWDVANSAIRSYGSKTKSYNLSNYSKIRFMLRGVYSPVENPSIAISAYFGSDYSKSYENRVYGITKKLNFSAYDGEAYDIDISSITGTKYIAFIFSTPALSIFSIKSIQLIA